MNVAARSVFSGYGWPEEIEDEGIRKSLLAAFRWVLVEAAERILPEVGESLGQYTVERLRERGMEVRLDTTVESMVGGRVVLSDGEELDAGTVVWMAGVKANPLAARSGLPVDHAGSAGGAAIHVLCPLTSDASTVIVTFD